MAADNQLQTRVNEICNDLYSRGERVSVRIILSMMPNVSSTSTIHKYYKAWRDELDQSQKSLLDKLGFSPEFTRAFMTEITRHATEAEKRYREIADDARSQADEAIEELQKVEGFLIEQNKLLDTKDQQIEQLKAEIAKLHQKVTDAVKDGQNALDLQKNTFEAADAERQKQLDAMAEKCQGLEATVESQRLALAKAELRVEGADQLVSEAKAQLATAITDHAKVMNDLKAEHKTTLKELNSALDAERKRSAKLDTSLAVALTETGQLAKVTTAHDALTQTVATLQADLHQANENLLQRDQKIEDLQSQLARRSRRTISLSRQV